MRKYNNKMKKTMIIMGILFVVIIIIFSLFLKKAIEVDKSVYEVGGGVILFDNEYNKITINDTGTIRMRWGGDYYLDYNKEVYNLGSSIKDVGKKCFSIHKIEDKDNLLGIITELKTN